MIDVSPYIGKPFRRNGRGPQSYDCYGLVKSVLEDFYKFKLPDFTYSSIKTPDIFCFFDSECKRWIRTNKPKEGCVVVIRNDEIFPNHKNHCGVYIGQGKFIHALLRKGVILSKINDPIWSNKIDGYYKWPR